MGMDLPGKKAALLQDLRRQLHAWDRAGGSPAGKHTVLPFGVPALDAPWPDNGLPLGTFHEAAGDNGPAGFVAASAFMASIAGRLKGTVLWCGRGNLLYPPALAALGLDPARLLMVRARNDKDVLAVVEEGLRHGALACVVGEIERLDLTSSRRLILACEKSGVTALVVRKPPRDGTANRGVVTAIAAASRWRVRAAPSSPHVIASAGRPRWQLDLLRSHYGTTGSWIVEAPDAQGYLHLPALLADRSPAETDEARRRRAG